MCTYGQSIRWTDRDGSVSTVTVDGRISAKQAKEDALAEALKFGWTPPKWWQWWRKNDTKLVHLIDA